MSLEQENPFPVEKLTRIAYFRIEADEAYGIGQYFIAKVGFTVVARHCETLMIRRTGLDAMDVKP